MESFVSDIVLFIADDKHPFTYKYFYSAPFLLKAKYTWAVQGIFQLPRSAFFTSQPVHGYKMSLKFTKQHSLMMQGEFRNIEEFHNTGNKIVKDNQKTEMCITFFSKCITLHVSCIFGRRRSSMIQSTM